MSKKYLLIEADLYYTGEHYRNTSQGTGDNPIVLFNSLTAAQTEKQQLERDKISALLQKEPLLVAGQYWNDVVYVADEPAFWEELKADLAITEIDWSNDELVDQVLTLLDRKFRAKKVDFYLIVEMELEE